MEKRIVILVHPGLPYKKTIRYGSGRARDLGAKLLLIGVIPKFDTEEKATMAVYEFAPYVDIEKRVENETVDFLEGVVQFCLDNGITVDTRTEKGRVEDVIKQVVRDPNVKLVVVPTPTKKAHHSAFFDAISQFTHSVLDHDLQCPVVSVLAT